MKKTKSYIAALALGALAFTACDDNWECPPMDVPTFAEGTEATMTIAELKTQYWQDGDSYGTQIGLDANGDSIILVGNIVSSDQSGNIYKSIVLQDKTGAITIGINQSSLYEEYPMGIRMALNVTGMTIGRYSGLMQLGTLDGTSVNRIELDDISPRIQLDYYGGEVDTTLTTISELSTASQTNEGKIQWQSRLIRINDVKFEEAGEPFTTGSTTSRYITDDEGNRMIVYNSSYSDFAYDTLPYGHGDVVGILSCYRTSWQLLLIDANSCIDFDGEGAPDPNLTTFIKESFSNTFGDFTANYVTEAAGGDIWVPSAKYGMVATGYINGTRYASDSYLTSAEIDLNGYSKPELTFSHCCNYFASTEVMQQQASLAVSVDGGDWEAIEIPTYSTNADWTFVDSGTIDLSAYVGKKIRIGFHYISTESQAGTWEIKNVVLTAIKNQ